MNLKAPYIFIVAIAEITALVIGYRLRPENSVPIIVPMLMIITAFMTIMLFVHSIRIRSYLNKTHHDIWRQITDYASFIGNGTYNVPAYYKFLFSDDGSEDVMLIERKALIRMLFILIPATMLSIPLDILYVFIIN